MVEQRWDRPHGSADAARKVAEQHLDTLCFATLGMVVKHLGWEFVVRP